jgi:mono/diheme cytochrome c family protein
MRRILAVLVLLAILAGAAFWFLTGPDRQSAGLEAVAAGAPDVANGAVVYHAGGCASCHATPEQDDRNRLGGGLKLASPFGTFGVPNISPHPRDGIGSWTLAQFQRALRGGVSPDGRHYYPAFPYQSLPAAEPCGHPGPVRASQDPASGRGERVCARALVPFQPAPGRWSVEARLPGRAGLQA